MSLKKLLKEKVDDKELDLIRKGFEIIGHIAIIEIPDKIIHLKQIIVEAILKRHGNVKTILIKTGYVKDIFRIAKYDIIYGQETETIVKEYGCKFLVNPTKVYYSIKLSEERERIVKQIKKDESVLVLFAGIGPYPITISKRSKVRQVIGIELNPKSIEYFKKNVKLNNVDVVVYEGDVKEVLPKIDVKFDRILIPAPYLAKEVIHLIRDKININGVIHYYIFDSANNEDKFSENMKKIFKRNGMDIEILNIKKCGGFAPFINRYVIDLRVVDLGV